MSDDHAMTRSELADRIGVSPHWVSRNVPARLFKIGGRCFWFSFCDWVATETAASNLAATVRSLAIEHILRGQSWSNGHRDALRAPGVFPLHDSE